MVIEKGNKEVKNVEFKMRNQNLLNCENEILLFEIRKKEIEKKIADIQSKTNKIFEILEIYKKEIQKCLKILKECEGPIFTNRKNKNITPIKNKRGKIKNEEYYVKKEKLNKAIKSDKHIRFIGVVIGIVTVLAAFTAIMMAMLRK